MQDDFILTVDYKGAAQDYVANLILQGYTHKIRVLISEQEIFFEPDEEGDYRAITLPGQEDKALQKIDRQLLQVLQEKIAHVLQ